MGQVTLDPRTEGSLPSETLAWVGWGQGSANPFRFPVSSLVGRAPAGRPLGGSGGVMKTPPPRALFRALGGSLVKDPVSMAAFLKTSHSCSKWGPP